jgi:uncharacterized membrane protein
MPQVSEQSPRVYHIVAYQFEGRNRAEQVIDLLKKARRDGEYKVPAWAVIEVDDKGKAHVSQSGRGGVGAAAGAGVGVLLGLIGGPAGLLFWTLGSSLLGGLAGKYLGHQFDADQLKALAVNMAPNTSAIVVVIEDQYAEAAAKSLGEYDAKVVTVTLGDQLSGEMASFATVDLGEDAGDEAASAQ